MSKPTKLPSGRWRIRYIDANGKRQSDTFTTFDIAERVLRKHELRMQICRLEQQFGKSEAVEITGSHTAKFKLFAVRPDGKHVEVPMEAILGDGEVYNFQSNGRWYGVWIRELDGHEASPSEEAPF